MVRHVVRVLRPSASSRQMAFAVEGQKASSRTARAIKLQRRSESSVQPVQRSHGGYECTPCDRSVLWIEKKHAWTPFWLKHVPVKISPLASLAIAVAAAMAFV